MKKTAHRLMRCVRLGRADFQQIRSVEAAGRRNPWTDGMLKEELSHEHGFHFGIRQAAAGGLAAYISADCLRTNCISTASAPGR